jgi:hypothetical protein
MERFMKRGLALCAALAATACVAPGLGGMGMDSNAAMSNSIAQTERQGANVMAAQAQAQATAARPGDEALSCDALQSEMTVMFNDPAFQASVNSMGASAQSQMDRAKAAQAGAVGLGIGSMAAGIAGSMIPGMGWLGMAGVQAQQAAAMAQMPAADRARAQMMGDTVAIMPQIYRGQRIYELAQAKKCAFINNQAPT